MRWLILRGLARQKEHWLDFASLLSEQVEEVLMLDLPGFGEERNTPVPLTIRGNTERVRDKFLSIRQRDQKWGILGISLGGMIAIDWAHRYLTEFEKVVVINSSAKDVGPIWQRLTLYGFYRLIKNLSARDIREKELEVLKMISNLKANDEETLNKMLEIASKSEFNVKGAIRQLIASSQFVLPSKLRLPTLILASLKDNMVDVRCSKNMAERIDSQIKFHPTAGHDLPLDDPQWVVQKVVEFESASPPSS